jgi:hypothetical protein
MSYELRCPYVNYRKPAIGFREGFLAAVSTRTREAYERRLQSPECLQANEVDAHKLRRHRPFPVDSGSFAVTTAIDERRLMRFARDQSWVVHREVFEVVGHGGAGDVEKLGQCRRSVSGAPRKRDRPIWQRPCKRHKADSKPVEVGKRGWQQRQPDSGRDQRKYRLNTRRFGNNLRLNAVAPEQLNHVCVCRPGSRSSPQHHLLMGKLLRLDRSLVRKPVVIGNYGRKGIVHQLFDGQRWVVDRAT